VLRISSTRIFLGQSCLAHVDGRHEGRSVLLDTVVDQDASVDNETDYLTAQRTIPGAMSRVVFDGLGVPGAAQGMSGKEQSTWTQVSGTRHKNCNVMRLFRHGNICPIVLEICVTMDFGGQYLAISRSILPVLVSCSKHQINLDDVVHALAYLLQCETTRIVISTNASDSWATQRAPESVGAHPCPT